MRYWQRTRFILPLCDEVEPSHMSRVNMLLIFTILTIKKTGTRPADSAEVLLLFPASPKQQLWGFCYSPDITQLLQTFHCKPLCLSCALVKQASCWAAAHFWARYKIIKINTLLNFTILFKLGSVVLCWLMVALCFNSTSLSISLKRQCLY